MAWQTQIVGSPAVALAGARQGGRGAFRSSCLCLPPRTQLNHQTRSFPFPVQPLLLPVITTRPSTTNTTAPSKQYSPPHHHHHRNTNTTTAPPPPSQSRTLGSETRPVCALTCPPAWHCAAALFCICSNGHLITTAPIFICPRQIFASSPPARYMLSNSWL